MERVQIGATKSSPAVDFDPEEGLLEICGESYPENCGKFYDPLFDLLGEYLESPQSDKLRLNMEIVYFNSSTSKAFMDLFDMLDDAVRNGKDIEVSWRFHEDNDIAQECGQEFQEDLRDLPFHLQQI
ncbi:MAG: DUF1987 domain-containing protein [Desulfovibrio sp.]|uniref:DUF1987 domain-containing protein n=1 Tax=Desulfovibrio sp. 7SRBS1 TaxID=3378064 RepID=UPI003B3D4FD7